MSYRVKNIVDNEKFVRILEKTKNPTAKIAERVLRKAAKMKGLSLEEVGVLANLHQPKLIKKMFVTAGRIKRKIYGERLVIFAPLYASNYCINDCAYCGFHRRNRSPREKLSIKEVKEQVKILEDMGHKRLLLEFGEHPIHNSIDYVVDVIKTIYATKRDRGEIRRVNVNIAATTIENYKKLKAVGIGTYQLFQETYHRETYEKLHLGPKADFERQLFAHDRAFKAGIDDLGIGVLFGLYDWRFELLGLVSHAQYLDRSYGVGPHTISVPRFQPAPTVDLALPHKVSEEELLQIIALLRMAVPYTGMIISTRERPEIRARAFEIGVSQTSAGSRAEVGGYKAGSRLEQFSLNDKRTPDEVIQSILRQNLLPSFCTACYRQGRTGKKFMVLAKPGKIHNLCRPNAILTFKEYLEDYASPETKTLGEKIIAKYLAQISERKRCKETKIRLKQIQDGERDIFF